MRLGKKSSNLGKSGSDRSKTLSDFGVINALKTELNEKANILGYFEAKF